jgi:hypothetical protein
MDAEGSGEILSRGDEAGWANDICENHKRWYAEWKERAMKRRKLQEKLNNRRNAV